MGLELVGGVMHEGKDAGQGAGQDTGQDAGQDRRDHLDRRDENAPDQGIADRDKQDKRDKRQAESLIAVARSIAGTHLRLSALADRLADLRRRLDPATASGDSRRPAV